jgi:hypothetical protein
MTFWLAVSAGALVGALIGLSVALRMGWAWKVLPVETGEPGQCERKGPQVIHHFAPTPLVGREGPVRFYTNARQGPSLVT